MQVHDDISNLPLFNNAVITIGTFDGVHTGHLQIIHQLKKEAAAIGGETVIITFHPHPRMIVNTKLKASNHEIKLINTLPEKIELLRKQNIDHLVIVPFTLEFSQQSAEEYIKDFLVKNFHPHTMIIGYDHHFGKNRQGDYRLLEAYQAECNFKVKEIPEHVLHHVTISSTRIRQALEEGDIATSNEYLGYPYFFDGIVVEGNKLGRTLGYPTANIEITNPHKLVPGNGVYAVQLSIVDSSLNSESSGHHKLQNALMEGMMNIGIRPTMGGTKRVIEVNIFNFDKDIYGQNIRVYLKYFLRKELKFNRLEALKEQLAIDKINANKVFKKS